MKIAIVNSFFRPWRGGAETYVYNLAKQLQRRGHNITVLCGSPPLKPGKQFLDGVVINRLRVAGRIYGTPIIPALPFELASVGADIIHAGFPSPLSAALASAVSRHRKIPAVLTWHNDLPLLGHTFSNILTLANNRLVQPLYLPQFKSIIATSDIYAKKSPILRAQKDRVVVIPHGVDTEEFNPKVSGEEVRSRLNVREGGVVLFVGALTRWHKYKGLDILMEAFLLLRNQGRQDKLLVVGGGDIATEYYQLAEQLGIRDGVIFAGEVPDGELPKYYASSDLLVLPSKDDCEGFGLVILEANATGKPAIGTTVGGVPSVIRDGYNGLLVPPNNPTILAQSIRRALEDEDLLRQMGKNGRAFAEHHDWSILAEQTEKLYERALAAQ